MKRKYFVGAAVVLSIGALICLSAFAEKEKCKSAALPETVKAALATACPDAEITEVKMKKESIKLYEVEVEKDGIEYELTLAPDGTIVAEETEIDASELPEAVTAALAGAQVKEVSKQVKSWGVTLKKLDAPVVSYEVETEQEGVKKELTFAADGSAIEKPCPAKKEGCPKAEKAEKAGCPKAAAAAAAAKKECTKTKEAETEEAED